MCIFILSDVVPRRVNLANFARLSSALCRYYRESGLFFGNIMNDRKSKACTLCKNELPLDMFYMHKCGRKKGKPFARCIGCCKIITNDPETAKRKAIWHQKNKERLYKKVLENKRDNPDAYKARRKKEREKIKADPVKLKETNEYFKEWRKQNKESRRKTYYKYRAKNKDRINSHCSKYMSNKYKTDHNLRIKTNLSSMVRYAMRNGGTKRQRTMDLLGCSIEEFINHMESKFTNGMTWDNYGVLGWHMDHIIPCASFDLTDEKQQRECFHYTNLQPLWHYENRAKQALMPNEWEDKLKLLEKNGLTTTPQIGITEK
jgi:hypothetical protein